MICKLCGQNQKLINAHIIPRGFFAQLNDGSGSIRMGSGKQLSKKITYRRIRSTTRLRQLRGEVLAMG
jgi:hypothetical protein